MSPLGHRLQILLDDERHCRITAGGVSVATLVREAIDSGLAGSSERRKSAGQRILDAPDIDLPEPTEPKRELDALRGRRG